MSGQAKTMRNAFMTRLIVVTGIVAALCSPCAAELGPNRPNILLIVADDLGYGELSIQGNPQIPTPNIDSIAKNGVRFTSGYVSGPYCSPTRAGLLTGRYQQRFGHEFNPGGAPLAGVGLTRTELTLAERLREVGYATGMFGKWHLGFDKALQPTSRGFDEFYGFLGGAHPYLNSGANGQNPILRGTKPVADIDHTTEAFAREAISFIDKHKNDAWFVYLPFNAVHGPMQSTEKYLGRHSTIQDPQRRRFAAMLSAMDDAVGEVLAKVRATGQERNTLVVFLSDNGGPTRVNTATNGPLRGFKAQTWEGGIRVPFMMQWKDHLPAGKVESRPVIQLDVLPTALAAAGVKVAPEWKIDGINLLPFLTGRDDSAPHTALYWRFGDQMAIRMGDWKLLKAPGAGAEGMGRRGRADTVGAHLFNLRDDIGEKVNLAAQEPKRVAELAATWERWNSEMVEPKWGPQGRQPQRRRARAPH